MSNINQISFALDGLVCMLAISARKIFKSNKQKSLYIITVVKIMSVLLFLLFLWLSSLIQPHYFPGMKVFPCILLQNIIMVAVERDFAHVFLNIVARVFYVVISRKSICIHLRERDKKGRTGLCGGFFLRARLSLWKKN